MSVETTPDLAANPRWAEEQLTESFDVLAERALGSPEVVEALRDPALAGFEPKGRLAEHKDEILLAPRAELSTLAEATVALEAAQLALRERTGPPEAEPLPAPSEAGDWLERLIRRIATWLRARWLALRARLPWAPTPTPKPPGAPDHTPGPTSKMARAPVGVERARAELGLDALESGRDVAARAYTETVSGRGMLRTLRRLIASEVEVSYSTTLPITSAPGLAELAIDDLEVATSASDALKRILGAMGGGSIGIAGPRGVGKTTLIRAFHLGKHRREHDATRSQLSVMVSAPVVYQGRDFVLHLFGELCKEALKSTGGQLRIGPAAAPHRPERRALAAFLLQVAATGTLLAAVPAGIAVAVLKLIDQSLYEKLLPAVVLLAAALAFGWMYAMPWRSPSRRGISLRAYTLPIAAALAFAGVTVGLLALLDIRIEPAVAWGAGIALAAAALQLGVMRATSMRTRYRRRESQTGADDLETIAAEWLDRIRYQQTFTSGWSGALRLPIGVEGGVTGSTQLADKQMSFPDVVEQLRAFLRVASESRDVLIAIDELDKMESEEAAGRFLNEIKGIFGIEHCFYLVSVSEDAMSRFERRGLPMRDEFDSSFDEILYMRYLTLGESRHVLRERVIGLPVPFLLLAHCMSGGLPRDLIRVTRTLVDLNAELGGGAELHTLCSRLVALELVRKERATSVAARAIATEPHASCFLSWAERLLVEDAEAPALLELAGCVARFVDDELADFVRSDGVEDIYAVQRRDREKLVDLAIELAALAYFFGTVLQTFSPDRTGADLRGLEREPAKRPRIELLAAARQAFATNRRVAWQLISEFRVQLDLREIEHPELWAPAYERSGSRPGERAAAPLL